MIECNNLKMYGSGFNVTIYEYDVSNIQPLQKIQNFAARLVLLAPRHHHSTPVLEKNCTGFPFQNVLSIKSLVVFQCYKWFWSCLPLWTDACLQSISYTTLSFWHPHAVKFQQYKHKTHGFRTFSCFGPHIWNSLPQDLRHCSTLSSFKAKLKTFLFSQYFHSN